MKVYLIKIILFFRSLFQQKRSIPDFFVVGTQKGGTSSLYSYLIQHPNILTAIKKEIHFFETPINRKKGIQWYLNHFPTIRHKNRKKAITGEGTPFMYSAHVPRLVHELAPKSKLIFLLRDPVSRAFSHFKHNIRRPGREPMSFGDAIRNEKSRISEDVQKSIEDEWYNDKANRMYSYIHRGLYAEQLERWQKFFPEKQILVLKSEEFFKDPQLILDRILEFLDLCPHTFNVSYQSNAGNYKDKISIEEIKYLEKFYEKSNNQLSTLLEKNYNKLK